VPSSVMGAGRGGGPPGRPVAAQVPPHPMSALAPRPQASGAPRSYFDEDEDDAGDTGDNPVAAVETEVRLACEVVLFVLPKGAAPVSLRAHTPCTPHASLFPGPCFRRAG
jgi:hypothetical protein